MTSSNPPVHGRIVRSGFRPHPLMAGPHTQTILPTLLRPRPAFPMQLERLELPDGDFIDLGWGGSDEPDAPVAVLVHGLGGNLESKYVCGLGWRLAARGWRVCAMQHRGAGLEPNRLPIAYNHGLTSDLRHLWLTLRQRHPRAFLASVGWSLGANVLLKALGEEGRNAPLDAACVVSVPFQLAPCELHLRSGFARIYQRRLLLACKELVRRKHAAFPIAAPADIEAALRARSFHDFDSAFTAPLNGYRDCDDYYARAACGNFLGQIRVPTWILHALDDPFMTPDIVPTADSLSADVTLELSERGGHVGFVGMNALGLPECWSEARLCTALERARLGERSDLDCGETVAA